MATQAPDPDLQRKIDALKRSFTEALGQRLAELETAMGRLDSAEPLVSQPNIVKAVLEQAHKIAGSAGTFGYREVSVVASEIEQLCDRIMKGTHGSDEAAGQELAAKIATLRASAAK